MDKKNSNPTRTCIDFEFIRSQSISRQAKVQEFWKYLDSQDILKAYEVPKPATTANDEDKCQCKCDEAHESSSSSSTEASSGPKLCGAKSKAKMVKEKKGVLADSWHLEKYLREDLRFADSVEVTYDEINAEIEDYQRRLLQCGCKDEGCACLKKTSR